MSLGGIRSGGVQMLTAWGQEAATSLQRLVEEDLAGLIDGPTSPEITLNAGLTVFDISALPDDGPGVSIVMAIVNSWLKGVLANQHNTVPTVFVVEEGWHIVTASRAPGAGELRGPPAVLAVHRAQRPDK